MQWGGTSEGVNKFMLADGTRPAKWAVSEINGCTLVDDGGPWLSLGRGKRE